LYRTGDLGWYREDGALEFLGRTDHQVKLRGHRIELGEIESALAVHPAVAHAIVLLRDDVSSEPCLVGYVVAQEGQEIASGDLREHLQNTLPSYAVPAWYVFLTALPSTANGKVDRLALPCPNRARPELQTPYVAPATPLEEFLAQVVAESLGVDKVGMRDNFFELGGHSLLAVQVATRLQAVISPDVPLLTAFFQDPTVARLAEAVSDVWTERGHYSELAGMLTQLRQMSDAEVDDLLQS
jgi:hypothetical protein